MEKYGTGGIGETTDGTLQREYVEREESVGEGTLLWATLALGHLVFFLNEKKINIFRLMYIALFLKVTY